MCLSLGLKYTDFKELGIGTIFDLITEFQNQKDKQNTKKENVRNATKEDDIMRFF